MASLEQSPPPPTPADADVSSPPPPSRRIPSWWRSPRLCVAINLRLPRGGLRPRKALIHSAWISLVGLFLIRLATAVTTATEARVFSIAGAAVASLPWLALFLATSAISLLFEAGACDLTWVFSGSGGGPPPRREEPRLASAPGEGSDGVGASNGIGSSTAGSEESTPSVAQWEPRRVSILGDDDRDDEGESSGGGEASDGSGSSTTGSEASTSPTAPPEAEEAVPPSSEETPPV